MEKDLKNLYDEQAYYENAIYEINEAIENLRNVKQDDTIAELEEIKYYLQDELDSINDSIIEIEEYEYQQEIAERENEYREMVGF